MLNVWWKVILFMTFVGIKWTHNAQLNHICGNRRTEAFTFSGKHNDANKLIVRSIYSIVFVEIEVRALLFFWGGWLLFRTENIAPNISNQTDRRALCEVMKLNVWLHDVLSIDQYYIYDFGLSFHPTQRSLILSCGRHNNHKQAHEDQFSFVHLCVFFVVCFVLA